MGIAVSYGNESVGPWRALRKFRKSSQKAISQTIVRLNTRWTRIYLGSATDDDFCAIATYLLYGYVLADNFREIDKASFEKGVQDLAEAKRRMVHGEIAKNLLDSVSERFEVAKAMVFDLSIGEQERLQKFIEKDGVRMLNQIQKKSANILRDRG